MQYLVFLFRQESPNPTVLTLCLAYFRPFYKITMLLQHLPNPALRNKTLTSLRLTRSWPNPILPQPVVVGSRGIFTAWESQKICMRMGFFTSLPRKRRLRRMERLEAWEVKCCVMVYGLEWRENKTRQGRCKAFSTHQYLGLSLRKELRINYCSTPISAHCWTNITEP
jgi:hypothetical protein